MRRLTDKPPEYTSEFLAFWQAYPHRPGNPKARAAHAFAELVAEGIEPSRLAQAAGRFAADCRRRGLAADYIPHARTWLAQRRYEDYEAEADDERTASAEPAGGLWPALQGLMTPAEYRSWIEPLSVEIDGDHATVTAPSKFAAQRIASQYDAVLRKALGVRHLTIEVRR